MGDKYIHPIKGVGLKALQTKIRWFSTELMFKDLSLAMDAIKETGTSIDYGLKTFKKFETLIHNGKGKLDFSIIVNQ